MSVESEDDDEDDDGASTRSTSYAGPSRLTQRQAAMKGFVEKTDYVSLGMSIPFHISSAVYEAP